VQPAPTKAEVMARLSTLLLGEFTGWFPMTAPAQFGSAAVIAEWFSTGTAALLPAGSGNTTTECSMAAEWRRVGGKQPHVVLCWEAVAARRGVMG
jgi:hypothetical protein